MDVQTENEPSTADDGAEPKGPILPVLSEVREVVHDGVLGDEDVLAGDLGSDIDAEREDDGRDQSILQEAVQRAGRCELIEAERRGSG